MCEPKITEDPLIIAISQRKGGDFQTKRGCACPRTLRPREGKSVWRHLLLPLQNRTALLGLPRRGDSKNNQNQEIKGVLQIPKAGI